MSHGGKRPGAGRKPGTKLQKTIDKEYQRALLRSRVAERLLPMIDAQIESAIGASQFVYRDDSGRFKVIDDPDELRARIAQGTAIRIFTRLPSTPAFTDLLNRAHDKPKEQPQEIDLTVSTDMAEQLRKARLRAHARNRQRTADPM